MGESKGKAGVAAVLMLDWLSRPGVRCRYGVQNAARKSTSRRLGSVVQASGRRGRRPLQRIGRRTHGRFMNRPYGINPPVLPVGADAPGSPKSHDQRPASRGFMRGTISVRSTIERQRYAGSAATRICYSGDLRSDLRLFILRGVKGTPPLAHFFPLFLWASKEMGPPEARSTEGKRMKPRLAGR